MSLKIRLKNLGILKHAEFSLGDLTVICGKNNTGKTYATYALYGFLQSWRDFISFPVSDAQIQSLLSNGGIKIELEQYVKRPNRVLRSACRQYTDQLDVVFAAHEGRFRDSEFHIQIGAPNIHDRGHEGTVILNELTIFTYSKEIGSEEITVTLGLEALEKEIDLLFLKKTIGSVIGNAVFSDSFPAPFIASAERTGAAIFRRELDFARNQLLEQMSQGGKTINPLMLLSKSYQRYPSPIKVNVDFIRDLQDVTKGQSFIAKEHPEVLEDFADIIGGEYAITQDDQLYYVPKGTGLKLTMVESSSAVRSLLDLGFYLHHVVEKGALLMVDEPELNLHPANQRRIARLFARLVNLGVKVFITTHSDYIVKELNTLIMLNHDKPHLKRIAKENGYQQSELIRSDQVKVYMPQEALVPLEEGQKRRRRGLTLVEADVDPVLGIEAPSFDKTIDDMNEVLEDIVWGAE